MFNILASVCQRARIVGEGKRLCITRMPEKTVNRNRESKGLMHVRCGKGQKVKRNALKEFGGRWEGLE